MKAAVDKTTMGMIPQQMPFLFFFLEFDGCPESCVAGTAHFCRKCEVEHTIPLSLPSNHIVCWLYTAADVYSSTWCTRTGYYRPLQFLNGPYFLAYLKRKKRATRYHMGYTTRKLEEQREQRSNEDCPFCTAASGINTC